MSRQVFKGFSLITVAFMLFCRIGYAQTATITAPAGGSTLHCLVPVHATYTMPAGDTVASGPGIRLYITDNAGHTQDVAMSYTKSTGSGTADYTWDTTQTKNGNVYLEITLPYTDAKGNPLEAVHLGLITVDVQNGYTLTPASCVATVTEPTLTPALPANNRPFTITSNHTVAWTRSDDCKTYSAAYRFELQTTYHTTTTPITVADTGVVSFSLPKRLGLVSLSQTETWHSTVTPPAPAQYQTYALTFGQESNANSAIVQGQASGSGFSVTR